MSSIVAIRTRSSVTTDSNLFIVPSGAHDTLVGAAFRQRGYTEDDIAPTVRLCAEAARHGIRTHHAIKALHLDHLFGSTIGGCQPGAQVKELPTRFEATKVWDAQKKIGPPVAYDAVEACIQMADRYGTGTVSVDNAWHYFWGGGYVLEAARRGYIAYTQCTAMLAEVVPFGGRCPALGTNPHTWALPTQDVVGFPILIDFATSAVAMGRVQQLKREGRPLPPESAVDADGRPTTDPERAAALLPFGAHKGYALGLLNEMVAGFIGGFRPTVRGHFPIDNEKHSPCFLFQVIHPNALRSGFGGGRTLHENLSAILEDIRGPGNEAVLLPGELEARNAARCRQEGGLLFSAAELDAFDRIADEAGIPRWDRTTFRSVS